MQVALKETTRKGGLKFSFPRTDRKFYSVVQSESTF